MKKIMLQVALFLVVISIFSTTASASYSTYCKESEEYNIQASEYFNSCNANLSFNGNNAVVDFAVYGTGIMSTLGAQKIVLQKYQSGKWEDINTWTDLYEENRILATGSVSHKITQGYLYRAVITFYSANLNGHDTRIVTTGSQVI